jgi:hydroxybutyrate-dimer hydrolase
VLKANHLSTQAVEARTRLLDYGILPEALTMGHANVLFSVWMAVTASYASAYAKSAAHETLCDISFAATSADGWPRALTDQELARAFSDNSGIVPSGGVSLIAPDAQGQARAMNLGHPKLAQCLRELRTHPAIVNGVKEAEMTGRFASRPPVVIIHGRADGLIAVNHSSRAYYAVNQRDSSAQSELRYYEVEHGHHFDAFLAMPDFAARLVPMQPHILHAMDLMAARLRKGTALPPSQVLRTKPRASVDGKLAPLATENLGVPRDRPAGDAIEFDGVSLQVPG